MRHHQKLTWVNVQYQTADLQTNCQPLGSQVTIINSSSVVNTYGTAHNNTWSSVNAMIRYLYSRNRGPLPGGAKLVYAMAGPKGFNTQQALGVAATGGVGVAGGNALVGASGVHRWVRPIRGLEFGAPTVRRLGRWRSVHLCLVETRSPITTSLVCKKRGTAVLTRLLLALFLLLPLGFGGLMVASLVHNRSLYPGFWIHYFILLMLCATAYHQFTGAQFPWSSLIELFVSAAVALLGAVATGRA